MAEPSDPTERAPGRPGLLRGRLWPVYLDLNRELRGPDALPLDRETGRLWSLVLASRRVPHQLKRIGGSDRWSVLVRSPHLGRAMEEIRLHREENARGIEVLPPRLRPVDSVEPTATLMGLLLLFYAAYTRTYPGPGLFPERWVDLGSVDAGLFLAGQWWRAVTGLTLHHDAAHVLGNAVIGGIFGRLICRRTGSGVGWLLVFLSGATGNVLNSLAHSPLHDSIGFSTAVFGSAGIMAGIRPFGVGGGTHGRGSDQPLHVRLLRFVPSALIPVGAGLGLLSMLGAGEQTDVGAHLFGFLAGLPLGLAAGWLLTRFGLPPRRVDRAIFGLTVAGVALCWTLAWLKA